MRQNPTVSLSTDFSLALTLMSLAGNATRRISDDNDNNRLSLSEHNNGLDRALSAVCVLTHLVLSTAPTRCVHIA